MLGNTTIFSHHRGPAFPRLARQSALAAPRLSHTANDRGLTVAATQETAMDSTGPKLPRICPDCGAVDAYTKRYVTGGGWRPVYRCKNCGLRDMPNTDDR